MLSCKEVSRLVSERHERPLGLWERLNIKLHLMMCSGCTRFHRQLDFITTAMRRFREREE